MLIDKAFRRNDALLTIGRSDDTVFRHYGIDRWLPREYRLRRTAADDLKFWPFELPLAQRRVPLLRGLIHNALEVEIEQPTGVVIMPSLDEAFPQPDDIDERIVDLSDPGTFQEVLEVDQLVIDAFLGYRPLAELARGTAASSF